MKTSVAICSFNGGKYISQQLLSILAQSRPIDELIICDDNSQDNTLSIVENILGNVKFEVKIIKNEINRGALYSFENCIKHCSSDIIFLSDQDDIWLPDKVQKFHDYFCNNPSTLALFSNGNLIDSNGDSLGGDLWSKWNFTREKQSKWRDNSFAFSELVHNRNIITGATLAFKRELVPKLIPFQLPSTYWHDSWIGVVAAGLGGLRFLPEYTISYRIHDAQQVGVSLGGADKKYIPIQKEEYVIKLFKMFPEHWKILFSSSLSLKSLLRVLLSSLKN